jgi:hypothetical protein
VEGEWGGKDCLLGNFDPLRLARNKFDDIYAAKNGRSEEICKGETVEDWTLR